MQKNLPFSQIYILGVLHDEDVWLEQRKAMWENERQNIQDAFRPINAMDTIARLKQNPAFMREYEKITNL